MPKVSSKQKVKVHFNPDNIDLLISKGENLLQAAIAAGVHIHASCGGSGVCGTCKVLIEKGEVECTKTEKLTDEEYKQGLRQACQCRVLSDLSVYVPVESRLEKAMPVLLEVNTSGEESKFGCKNEDQLFSLIDDILILNTIEIQGLMTVGPFTDDKQRIRDAFIMLRELRDKTQARYSELELKELSMGMSADYEIAVEEGSTLVRVGTSIFGPRHYG